MALITAQVDYIEGYLKYGHFELSLFGEELQLFKKMDRKEKIEYLIDHGDLVVDQYELNDYGNITSIEIYDN